MWREVDDLIWHKQVEQLVVAVTLPYQVRDTAHRLSNVLALMVAENLAQWLELRSGLFE
jgi:hypothetical protein